MTLNSIGLCRNEPHKKNTRLLNLKTLICWGGLFLWSTSWCAYPEKAITVVVPFAAGSGTDAVARVVAQGLSDKLKQPVVIDNRAGANAQIGAQYVAQAASDGYTLLMTTATSHSANPALFKKLNYDPINDFTAIAKTGSMPFVLVTRPGLALKSIQELIAYARANPGKVSFANTNGTSMVAALAMAKIAQVDLLNVGYKSAPQAMTDVLGGQVDFYVVDFALALPHIRSGKVNALGLAQNKASKILPSVPTLAQTIPGFDLNAWNGLFGPAKLPKAVAQQLAAAVHEVLIDPKAQEKMAVLGFEIDPSNSPLEFEKFVADQLAYWHKMVDLAQITPE
jgi:tripartite-type tricarboxylate transporter receptor subunit TctC